MAELQICLAKLIGTEGFDFFVELHDRERLGLAAAAVAGDGEAAPEVALSVEAAAPLAFGSTATTSTRVTTCMRCSKRHPGTMRLSGRMAMRRSVAVMQ